MTVTLMVSDRVAQQLNNVSWAQNEDIETKLSHLVEAEHRRRLARYRLTDRRLTDKYGMSFNEFERRDMIRTSGYTWEVESDAIAWETAIDGIATMEQQLRELFNGDG
ncbi:MAG: hypothetical protein IAE85_20575 [Anaerolinea sp.]|nr:hypothetical protein [Anaerolinea sp.]